MLTQPALPSANFPLNKIIAAGVIALIAIVVGLVIFKPWEKSKNSSPPTASVPTPKPTPIHNVLYPQAADHVGRDTYYFLSGPGGIQPYSGVGTYIRSQSKTDPKEFSVSYLVGSFLRWEDISGSPDKYLILNNALLPKALLPKIRVKFGKDSSTILMVESLDWLSQPKSPTLKPTPALTLGPLSTLAQADLAELFKTGDTVAVIPLHQSSQTDILDRDKNRIAEKLVIRRVSVRATMEKELGHSLNLQ